VALLGWIWRRGRETAQRAKWLKAPAVEAKGAEQLLEEEPCVTLKRQLPNTIVNFERET